MVTTGAIARTLLSGPLGHVLGYLLRPDTPRRFRLLEAWRTERSAPPHRVAGERVKSVKDVIRPDRLVEFTGPAAFSPNRDPHSGVIHSYAEASGALGRRRRGFFSWRSCWPWLAPSLPARPGGTGR